MAVMNLHVDDATLERLQWYQRERAPDRTIEDLAEAAIAEAALQADDRGTLYQRRPVAGGRMAYGR